jgi:hypothetical protein
MFSEKRIVKKEEIIIYFDAVSRNSNGKTEEHHKALSQDIMRHGLSGL